MERAVKHGGAQPESGDQRGTARSAATGGELDTWDLTPDPFPKGKGNL
jgi:hypothetical protein